MKESEHKFQTPKVKELTPAEKLLIRQDAMKEAKRKYKGILGLPSEKK